MFVPLVSAPFSWWFVLHFFFYVWLILFFSVHHNGKDLGNPQNTRFPHNTRFFTEYFSRFWFFPGIPGEKTGILAETKNGYFRNGYFGKRVFWGGKNGYFGESKFRVFWENFGYCSREKRVFRGSKNFGYFGMQNIGYFGISGILG